jgi:hypothetical protein
MGDLGKKHLIATGIPIRMSLLQNEAYVGAPAASPVS